MAFPEKIEYVSKKAFQKTWEKKMKKYMAAFFLIIGMSSCGGTDTAWVVDAQKDPLARQEDICRYDVEKSNTSGRPLSKERLDYLIYLCLKANNYKLITN